MEKKVIQYASRVRYSMPRDGHFREIEIITTSRRAAATV